MLRLIVQTDPNLDNGSTCLAQANITIFCYVTMSSKGNVVLVTGAAGFLGQRIVELLDCKGENIREIRGFDIRDEGKYFADNTDNKKLRYIRGDICDIFQVCVKL